jgi:hypothetical protein
MNYTKQKLAKLTDTQARVAIRFFMGTKNMPTLFDTTSMKIKKSNDSYLGDEFKNIILYLAPGSESGYNVCPKASKGCLKSCLFTSGNGNMPNVVKSRIRRTQMWVQEPHLFKRWVEIELDKYYQDATAEGKILAVRLNGTSDIVWEKKFPEIFNRYTDDMGRPTVVYYDYTKIVKRFAGVLPVNYFLTFSKSESNDKDVRYALTLGANVAVVFAKALGIPESYLGAQCIDGDSHDMRFADLQGGYVVALYAKGQAQTDKSGFVVRELA